MASRSLPRALAPLAVCAVLVASCSGGGADMATFDPNAPTTTEPGEPDAFPPAERGEFGDPVFSTISDEPNAYRITYDSLDPFGEKSVTNEEIVTVLRPFWSSVIVTHEDGELLNRSFSWLGKIATGGNDEPVILETLPTVPTGDLRISHVLDALVESGELALVGGSTDLLEDCNVYESREPIVGADIREEPDEANFTHTCISERGLIIEERWVINGRSVRDRRAALIELLDEVDADDFEVEGQPFPPELGGTQLILVDSDELSDGTKVYWSLDEEAFDRTTDEGNPIGGFEHLQRYQVIELLPGGGLGAPIPLVSLADVYVNGIDYLLVRHGPGAARHIDPERIDDEGAEHPLGKILVETRTDGTRAGILLEDGSTVVLSSTLGIDAIEAAADALIDEVAASS